MLQKARGSYAPYKIVNRTGGPIYVWSDSNGSNSESAQSIKIDQGSAVDWRFDDWRKMREVPLLLVHDRYKSTDEILGGYFIQFQLNRHQI